MSSSDGKSQPEWAVRWTVEAGQGGRSGGQGTVRKVRSIADGTFGALKVLHVQHESSSERRFRMKQEANALSALGGAGVPKLLDCNEGTPPHIVMEWIDGPTLSDFVGGKPQSLDDALQIADALLETLEQMHALPVYHRDLKPDNIILRDGAAAKPVIVDLGMAWAERDQGEFRTPDGQELGNRTLRLPELAAGSAVGNDPRSDIAMLLGVIFFVITGRLPRVLLDEQSRKPHERTGSIPKAIEGDKRWAKLRGIFSIGFEPGISNRFQTVAELRERLQNLDPVSENGTLADIEAAIAGIEEVRSSAAARQLHHDQLSMRAGSESFLRQVQAVISKAGMVAGGSGPNFSGGGRSDGLNFFIVPQGDSIPLVEFSHSAFAKDGKITMSASAGGRAPRDYYHAHLADIDGIRAAAESEARSIAAELLRLMKAKLEMQHR